MTEAVFKSPCQNCDGKCCDGFNLTTFNPSPLMFLQWKKEFPKNDYPLRILHIFAGNNHKLSQFWVSCDWHDKETGKCKHYSQRPDFCKNFMCHEGLAKLCMIQNFPEAPP